MDAFPRGGSGRFARFALTLCAIVPAAAVSAAVYRAGLVGGYLNSYDGNSFHSVSIPDIGCFYGPEAGRSRTSDQTTRDYPPIWVNNRTWSYHGLMRFDGGGLWFVEGIDDSAYVAVDGTQVLRDVTWNNNAVSGEVRPEAGWHEIVFRFGNGTGGAGVFSVDDLDKARDSSGDLCGFGIARTTKPTKMADCEFPVDPGDGSLFRTFVADSYMSVDGFAKTETGYAVTVTSLAPAGQTVSIRIMAGAEDLGETETGWKVVTEAAAFEPGETKTLAFDWSDDAAPRFRLLLTGTDESQPPWNPDFFEWSESVLLDPLPVVSARLKNIDATGAAFVVTVGYSVEIAGYRYPAVTVTGVFGSEEGGATADDWDSAVDAGVLAAGEHEFVFTGLSENTDYAAAFFGEIERGDSAVSQTLRFSTCAIAVTGPSTIYETDPRGGAFTLTRPEGCETEEVTVNLFWSGAADAFADLPATAVFAAGERTTEAVAVPVNDEVANGDRTLVLSLATDPSYRVDQAASSVTVRIVDDESRAGPCVWTNGGGDLRWNNPENWQGNAVPTLADSAVFTSDGLSANVQVLVSGEACCKTLVIGTTTAFSLTADGVDGTLMLGGITRTDVEGTEGNHDIRVPLTVFAGGGTNCVWDLAGSNSLRIYSDMAKAGTAWVFKTGAGTVEMHCKGTTFAGPWIIREGVILCPEDQGNTFKGATTIGGGENPAKLQQSMKNSIAGKTPLTILANGVFQSGDLDNGRVETVDLYAGGVANVSSYFYTLYANFHGGTYNGGAAYNAKDIRTYASDTAATMNVYWRFDGYGDYSVVTERGTVPVDLLVRNGLAEGSSGRIITKSGAGVVKSTVNFNNLKNHFKINGGTWLVDNPGEYGLGIQECTVAKGATIGGTGCVGMKDSKGGATLTLVDGDATTYATIAPGTVDEVTGAHSNGTFTVSRESAHNALSLGKYARLVAGVGDRAPGSKMAVVDKVKIYGQLWIGENCTLDLVTNTTAFPKDVHCGEYVIAEAVDGISGTFATVLLPDRSWKVVYRETEVVLVVPTSALSFSLM